MSFFDTKDRGTDYVLIDGVGGGDTFERAKSLAKRSKTAIRYMRC